MVSHRGAVYNRTNGHRSRRRSKAPDHMGRSCAFLSRIRMYSKLLLRTTEQGDRIWLKCLTATADFYGWTDAFEPWSIKSVGESGGYSYGFDPGRKGHPSSGGTRLRICRSKKRGGNPAGKTNCFRVHSRCTNYDLSELAFFTRGEWHWMEGFRGIRRSKAQWLDMYEHA